jgi:hypothetical protein
MIKQPINYFVLEENGKPICVYMQNLLGDTESFTFYKTKHLPSHYSPSKEYSPYKRASDLRLLSFEEFRDLAAQENLLKKPEKKSNPLQTAFPGHSGLN